MSALPKSCIIGAGCSGFTTAKALQDRGLPFDIFEMTGDIGGTWNFNNPGGKSACYQSLHIDTSKTRMQFRDFPIPANDDASNSVGIIVDVVTDAIREGLGERKLEREKEYARRHFDPNMQLNQALKNAYNRSY